MDGDRSPLTSALGGLCLLPSELIHEILLRLSIPDLLPFRSVSRAFSSLLASPDFHRVYSPRSAGPCLFLLAKRFPRHPLLCAFHHRSPRWLRLPLPPAAAADEPYLLAASGDHLIFASNSRRGLLALNLASLSISVLPPSPLGPRRTSSWRRSGLKLVSDPGRPDRFCFLFAEFVHNRPFLFQYTSDTGTWRSSEAVYFPSGTTRPKEDGAIWLKLVQHGREGVILGLGHPGDEPIALQPRWTEVMMTGSNGLHVYGDGNAAVVRSEVVDEGARVVTGVEVCRLGRGGEEWEWVSKAPDWVMEEIRRPYGVMMGCLEESEGVIRLVLVSHLNGEWHMSWLGYDRIAGRWFWVHVPDFGSNSKGLNMAGIAISSFFSGLRLLS